MAWRGDLHVCNTIHKSRLPDIQQHPHVPVNAPFAAAVEFSAMALPPPILLFFSGLLSKDNSGASMPGNEVVSLLALSCGSAEAGARVAASLRDSGVLRVIGVTESPIGGPFDPVAVYDVVEPESSSSPSPSLLAQTPPRPGTEGSSSALGRSSLSLSVTRSASRDADGGTTSAGVVRLLASSATVAGSAHAYSPEDGGPPSASLVAALVQVARLRHSCTSNVSHSSPCALQAPLCVSVSVPSASRVLREDADRFVLVLRQRCTMNLSRTL